MKKLFETIYDETKLNEGRDRTNARLLFGNKLASVISDAIDSGVSISEIQKKFDDILEFYVVGD